MGESFLGNMINSAVAGQNYRDGNVRGATREERQARLEESNIRNAAFDNWQREVDNSNREYDQYRQNR